jgi:hypothetical protein
VGSLHHKGWIIRDKVLVTNKILWDPYIMDSWRSFCTASCMIRHTITYDPNSKLVLQQRADQSRQFPYVLYFHLDMGYVFSPLCPVCVVGHIFIVYLVVAFIFLDRYTPLPVCAVVFVDGCQITCKTVYKDMMIMLACCACV